MLIATLFSAPSATVLAHYIGNYAWLAMVMVVFAALTVALLPTRQQRVLGERTPWWWPLFLGCSLCAVSVAFFFVYPVVNAQLPGRGSDRDDALNLAASALLQGDFPYAATTYLGNPVTPLPGAILMSLPFVALGNSAYQALFWLLAWGWAVGRVAVSGVLAVVGGGLVLLSPESLRETLSGGDLLVNGVYVCLSAAWLAHTALSARTTSMRLLVAAALFGLALASRPNFAVMWPITLACIARSAGLRSGVLAALVSVAAFLAVTVPVYVWNPAGFSPLHIVSKIGFSSIPGSGVLIPLISGVVAVWLAIITHRDRMMWDCALAGYTPFLLMAIFASVDAGALTAFGLGYGLCALPFLGWAVAARQHEQQRVSASA